MKRIYALGISILMSGGLYAQDVNDLPETASDYINRNFPTVEIDKVDVNNSWYNMSDSETYEVELVNGMELDFNKKGEITEIENDEGEMIPEGVFDRSVWDYFEQNYADAVIVNYEIDKDGYDLELEDGRELKFDSEGTFLEEDS